MCLINVKKWKSIDLFFYIEMIKKLSVMSDYVHAIVGILLIMSISQVFHLLKGFSLRELFNEKLHFRKRCLREHFFSPSKFCRIVGDFDTEIVIKYV